MEGIKEIIEPKEAPLGYVIDYRTSNLADMQGFGSPDLCWIVRETVRSGMMNMLKKKTVRNSFHYVYGADTSSQATVIAYFQQFLNDN
jgi:hypothetical protein